MKVYIYIHFTIISLIHLFIDNYFGDVGIHYFFQVINKLTRLQVVNINNNRISYRGLEHIGYHNNSLTSIIELNLGNNELTIEAGYENNLSKPTMRSLKILQIPSVSLNSTQMSLFANYFQYYTQLYQLTLSNNALDSHSAGILSKYLMLITSLYVLEIDNNKIQTEGMISLSKNISHLKNLVSLNVNSMFIILYY